MRHFPNFGRAFGDAIGFERWSRRPHWAGERILDMALYECETDCDWTSGSFMFARREAVLTAGLLDERFFLYSEEPDLCLRIKQAGWRIRHVPSMTILHHAGKAQMPPKMAAQEAFSRRQYARKHFSGPHRLAYLAAVGSRHLARLGVQSDNAAPHSRQAAELACARSLASPSPRSGRHRRPRRYPQTQAPVTATGCPSHDERAGTRATASGQHHLSRRRRAATATGSG